MKLDYLILGMLKMNPSTGYDLKKVFDTEGRFGRKRPPLSQIYTTLKRMNEKGWVTFVEEQRDGKPDLKIYQLTDQGEQELQNFLRTPVEPLFRYKESDVLYRVMFSTFLDDVDATLDYLQTELDYRKSQIVRFRDRDRTIRMSGLTEAQAAEAQEIMDMLHYTGASGLDEYVRSLETIIGFFNQRKER